MTKRTLKGGQPKLRPVKKPRCAKHLEEMFFNVRRQVWECPKPDCKMVAHPSSDVGGGRAIAFEPPFDLLVVHDSDTDEYTYLLSKDKVYFDITRMIGSGDIEDGWLELKFDNIVKSDQYGRKLKS